MEPGDATQFVSKRSPNSSHNGRFRKGKSGNPKGRPKRKRSELVRSLEKEHLEMEAAIFRELDRMLTVTLATGGPAVKIRARDAIARALVGKAARGDGRALLLLHKFTGQTAKALKSSNPAPSLIDVPLIDLRKDELLDMIQNMFGVDLANIIEQSG